MKKLTLISLVIVLVLAMAFGACAAKPEPEIPSQGSETQTPASETPAKTEVIKLKLAYGSKAPKEGRYTYTQEIHNWAEAIGEKTDGRVQIDVYPAESLLEYENIFQGVVSGIAEIGYWSPHYDMSAFPLTTVFEVPGLPWGTAEQTYEVMQELYNKFPELQAEYEGTKPLFFTSQPSSMLAIAKDLVVHTPEDMKGLKIACADSEAKLIETVNATPVSIPGADRYLALERGMVDGTEIVWGGVLAFQLFDVCKTFTEHVGFGQACSVIIVNQETWDSFPSDIQDIFYSLNQPTALALMNGYNIEGDAARQASLNAGRTIYVPTAEESQLWSEAFAPLREEWIQEREAEGMPGRELLEELMSLMQ